MKAKNTLIPSDFALKNCKFRSKQFSKKDNPNVSCFHQNNLITYCDLTKCPLIHFKKK
jgi:hypothetical protein